MMSKDEVVREMMEEQERKDNREEIIEGNKLICSFMGDEFLREKAKSMNTSEIIIEQLNGSWGRFDCDWSWIMPTIEKIAVDYDVRISWYNTDCVATICNTSIEGTEIADFGNYTPAIKNVWLAVIQFIKWYDKNNHP